MKKYPKVCIIITNYNGKEVLRNCLSSLFKLTDYPNYKVIVVDNGSTDSSVEFVKKNFKKVDVLALDKNYGFSKESNIGVAYCIKRYKPKYLVILNNDIVIIEKNWLSKLVKSAEVDQKIAIVGCKTLQPDGRLGGAYYDVVSTKHLGFLEEDKTQYSFEKDVMAVGGSCFLIRASLIKKYGLLDEIFFYGPDDIDVCFRYKKNGFRVVYNGNVEIIHIGSFSQKKVKNIFVFKFLRRGRLILFLRYYPLSFIIKEIIDGLLRCFVTRRELISKKYIGNLIFHYNFFVRIFYWLWSIKEALIWHNKYSYSIKKWYSFLEEKYENFNGLSI
jgi:GT2 family glycosyltransferase